MKNYKKLIIPKDSVWDRKTLSARIRRNLHWRIRYFIGGCKNILRWVPTLYKDKDWDDWYIFTILQKKIEFQRKEIIYANRHMDVDRDNRDMTIVLNLIERIKEQYYETEYLDYEDSDITFKPVDGNEKLKSVDVEVLSETYNDFLKKYPSSVREVLKKHPNISKRDLCHFVSQHNQEKAHNLLFKILKERMRWWWN
jgi:hypothetical protein